MNRLTIIPIDKSVYIEGEAFMGIDLSFIPHDIHALQWQDNNGWIERKGFADEMISELPDWAMKCIDLWNEIKNNK